MIMDANAPPKVHFNGGLADNSQSFFAAAHLREVPSQLFVFNVEFTASLTPRPGETT